MFSESPGVFLADFGCPCTCGAYPFTGTLDAPDDTLSMGGVNQISTMYVLEVLTSDVVAAGIQTGSTIVVDATSMGLGVLTFCVRDVLAIDDGVFKHLTLQK